MKYRSEQPSEGTSRPSQMSFFNRQTNAQAVIQPKLTVGSAHDAHEHEANRTADMVMRKPDNSVKNGTYTEGSSFMPTITPVIQRACAACEHDKEQTAQRKETGAATGGFTAPPSVSRAISRSGNALDSNAKTFMESRFNRSFDNVQVHTDSDAASSARDISARAYTSGNHIVFGEGQYQPNSEGGRHLLAHELTHTIQQGHDIKRSAVTSKSVSPAPPSSTPSPTVRTESIDVVVKSFIAPIGLSTGFISCPTALDLLSINANVSLRTLGVATDLNFSENPTSASMTKDYRLFSNKTFDVSHDGTNILGVTPSAMTTDVGMEGPLTPPPMTVMSDRDRRIDSTHHQFNWSAKGRPHLLAEPAFQLVCPRTSVFIWHSVSGVIEMSGGRPVINASSIALTDSKFPSDRVFINNSAVVTHAQGDFKQLWEPSPSDPFLVG
jgi:hypothetical protein